MRLNRCGEIMKITRGIVFMLVVALFSGCAMYHRYGSYYGKVVDAETKEPLEGAAVLAVYYTNLHLPAGEMSRYLDAQETVTDKNGEFKIPSMTKFTFRPLHTFDPYVWFTIFKPGYGCYPSHKGVRPMFIPNGTLPKKEYVTLELPKLATREERLLNTDCYPVSVPDHKMKKFIEINNIENINLGLQPAHIQEGKR